MVRPQMIGLDILYHLIQMDIGLPLELLKVMAVLRIRVMYAYMNIVEDPGVNLAAILMGKPTVMHLDILYRLIQMETGLLLVVILTMEMVLMLVTYAFISIAEAHGFSWAVI